MPLPAWMRRWVYGAGSACLGTGLLWLLFHHFIQTEGDFGPEPHRLEHTWLVLHGAAAIAMGWVFGLVWLAHVRRGWQQGHNRGTGSGQVALLVLLMVSGWGLYYLGDETWREFTSLGHWGLGLLAAFWLPLHVWRGRRRRAAHAS